MLKMLQTFFIGNVVKTKNRYKKRSANMSLENNNNNNNNNLSLAEYYCPSRLGGDGRKNAGVQVYCEHLFRK